MRFKNKVLFAGLIIACIFSGCKKWEDHTALTSQDLTQNVLQAVSANSNLSKFKEYITRSGLDTLLGSSKTFTIWAPTDNALATLDPAIVNDPVRLKAFVLNHISNQSYFTRNAQTALRIQMLSGKYNQFTVTKFEDANITAADKYVRNGVLHVIDGMTPVLQNVWEYINGNTASYIQNAFITSLNFTSFDPSLAIVDSISVLTGLPVYRPGTGLVNRNSFNDRVYDLKREDKRYTYFVIQNAGFTVESDSLKPYFNTNVTASTDSLAKWNTVKDLAVEGNYAQSSLNGLTLVSKSGVSFTINTGLITGTVKLSNGTAYILSILNVLNANKIRERRVEGENPSGFLIDRTGNTNYRVRLNPATGLNYSDIMVTGHGVTDYYAFYRLNEMPTLKYNVYARAFNDFQTQVVYQSIAPFYFVPPSTSTQIPAQPLFTPLAPRSPAQLWYPVPGIGGTTPLPAAYSFTPPGFAAVSSSLNAAHSEIFLGSFTFSLFGTLDIRLISGATATLPALPVFGNTGTGPMVLDYLRLVPVL